MKVFSTSRIVLSGLLVSTVTVLSFQNCSKFSAINEGDSLGSQIKFSSAPMKAGKILSAKLSKRQALVLKPADHPHLVNHATYSGLFTDGPPHPWKDDLGNTYVNVPHSENFRYLIGNGGSAANPWDNPSAWQIQEEPMFDSRKDYVVNGVTYHRGGNCSESEYDNRFWLFGFWSFGKTIAAIAHHEWYAYCARGYSTLNGNPATFNTHWVNAIGHLVSQDGGRSFLPKPLKGGSNSDRLVMVPEPKNVQNPAVMYGFFHPSNIVKEGDYYYATVETRHFLGQRNSKGREVMSAGFSLIRTKDVLKPTGWEVYDENRKWSAMQNYQGNKGQKPYIFFSSDTDPYETANTAGALAMNLRYHEETRLWLTFGVLNGRYTILQSETLASPEFDSTNAVEIQGSEASFPWYISVFDPSKYKDAQDLNYMNVGNNLLMLHMKSYEGYAMYDVTLTVSGAKPVTTTVVEPPAAAAPAPPVTPTNPTTPNAPTTPVVSPAPAVVSVGLFMQNGVGIYYSNGTKYCVFPSMGVYQDITGSTATEGMRKYSTLPSGMAAVSPCFRIPEGLFKTGIGLYYSNGGAFCYFPNMELFTAKTGRTNAEGIRDYPELPIVMANGGNCK